MRATVNKVHSSLASLNERVEESEKQVSNPYFWRRNLSRKGNMAGPPCSCYHVRYTAPHIHCSTRTGSTAVRGARGWAHNRAPNRSVRRAAASAQARLCVVHTPIRTVAQVLLHGGEYGCCFGCAYFRQLWSKLGLGQAVMVEARLGGADCRGSRNSLHDASPAHDAAPRRRAVEPHIDNTPSCGAPARARRRGRLWCLSGLLGTVGNACAESVRACLHACVAYLRVWVRRHWWCTVTCRRYCSRRRPMARRSCVILLAS